MLYIWLFRVEGDKSQFWDEFCEEYDRKDSTEMDH